MHSGQIVGGSDEIGGGDPVRALRAAVDRIARIDVPAEPDTAVAAELVGLRREMDRLDAKYAELVSSANRRGVGREDGHHSTGAWIRWQTGQTLGQIRSVQAAGEVAELLPATGSAWAAGTSAPGPSR